MLRWIGVSGVGGCCTGHCSPRVEEKKLNFHKRREVDCGGLENLFSTEEETHNWFNVFSEFEINLN